MAHRLAYIEQRKYKMNRYPLVSIITINYKQSAVTNDLIESLQKLTWPNVEVLIVDNNSGEDCNYINTAYINTKLIKSNANLGFAGGNNLGIKESKGDYILLLNNDTIVAPGFIDPLVARLESDESIGAVSPKIKYYEQPDTIQYAGFTSMNPLTLRMNAIGFKQTDSEEFKNSRETHFAHGCAMMVKREIIESVGMMPENYFLYYEEHDWSSLIKRAGYKIWFEAKSVVLHKESMSVQKNSTLKTYYLNRNRILYMRRNFSGFTKLIAWLYLLTVSLPKNILKYMVEKESEHLQAYLKGFFWNLKTAKTQ